MRKITGGDELVDRLAIDSESVRNLDDAQELRLAGGGGLERSGAVRGRVR